MTPERRSRYPGVTRASAISAAVTVALIAAGSLLTDYGPTWLVFVLAAVAALTLAAAYFRDRRRGQRWF